MAAQYKEGDRVQISDRAATAEDTKSGLFYDYFRGLTGVIQKIYATEEVAIELEQESLEEAISRRHLDVQEQMRAKFMDNLSEEGRNRLDPAEKNFRLRYSVLVTMKDLTAPTHPKAETPPRLTTAELEAKEEAELQKRRGANGAAN